MTESEAQAGVGRQRSGVVLIEHGRVAVIERRVGADTWYLLPGGGPENGETVERAAIREAKEELGLDVNLGGLVAEVWFDRAVGTSAQVYFRATRRGGVFGPGTGAEYLLPTGHPSGTYEPTWLELAATADLDVRPRDLFSALRTNDIAALEANPLRIHESVSTPTQQRQQQRERSTAATSCVGAARRRRRPPSAW